MVIPLLLTIATSLPTGQFGRSSTIELAYGDTRGADLWDWVVHAKTEIEKRWVLPYAARRRVGHAAIALTVDRNGWLVDTVIEKPSEIPDFDREAAKAVRSAKLLPLPGDYPEERFTLTLVFWLNENPYDLFDGTRHLIEPISWNEPPVAVETERSTPSPADEPPPAVASESETSPPLVAEENEQGAPRERVLVFADGSTLGVERYEIQGDLVLLYLEGRRVYSLPRTSVDWESTARRAAERR